MPYHSLHLHTNLPQPQQTDTLDTHNAYIMRIYWCVYVVRGQKRRGTKYDGKPVVIVVFATRAAASAAIIIVVRVNFQTGWDFDETISLRL